MLVCFTEPDSSGNVLSGSGGLLTQKLQLSDQQEQNGHMATDVFGLVCFAHTLPSSQMYMYKEEKSKNNPFTTYAKQVT